VIPDLTAFYPLALAAMGNSWIIWDVWPMQALKRIEKSLVGDKKIRSSPIGQFNEKHTPST
jgi:hypothetical protein